MTGRLHSKSAMRRPPPWWPGAVTAAEHGAEREASESSRRSGDGTLEAGTPRRRPEPQGGWRGTGGGSGAVETGWEQGGVRAGRQEDGARGDRPTSPSLGLRTSRSPRPPGPRRPRPPRLSLPAALGVASLRGREANGQHAARWRDLPSPVGSGPAPRGGPVVRVEFSPAARRKAALGTNEFPGDSVRGLQLGILQLPELKKIMRHSR